MSNLTCLHYMYIVFVIGKLIRSSMVKLHENISARIKIFSKCQGFN